MGSPAIRGRDLFSPTRALRPLDKWLLTRPARERSAWSTRCRTAGQRIVYVSCDPATLARDADVLVHQKGFRLAARAWSTCSRHTAHVESIALFERQAPGGTT